MSTKSKQGLTYIIQAINNIVEPKVASLRYDKTYRAKVTQQIDAGIYVVQINGKEYQLPYSGTLNIGDIVKVKAPLNNFSDIYIEALPGSGGGGEGGTTNYNDLTNKPILNTDNASSLDINKEEIMRGTVSLHKVSKTGNYDDLNGLPNLDFIPISQKGVSNGVATLGENSRVLTTQLPGDIVYDENYIHTDNNFTTPLLNKLNGIEAEAQVNKIELIKRNGVDLEIQNKSVNILVPLKTSELENDGDGNGVFITANQIASTTTLGLVKIGANLTITSDGTLSATGGGGSSIEEVEISDVAPTEETVKLWVDTSIIGNGSDSGGISITEILDRIYPIGSIYMSTNNISPEQFIGGTWQEYAKGKTLIGVDESDSDFDISNKTGGEKTHTLSISEIPSYTHLQNPHTHIQEAHSHDFNGTTSSSGTHYHTGNKLTAGVNSSTGVNDVVRPEGYSGTNVQVVDNGGAHTHSFSGSTSETTAINGNTTATNLETGGDQAHNNLQPYITCYMWERIA